MGKHFMHVCGHKWGHERARCKGGGASVCVTVASTALFLAHGCQHRPFSPCSALFLPHVVVVVIARVGMSVHTHVCTLASLFHGPVATAW